jgi:glycosyltransferase involved in cell wall biosynthesis
MTVGAAVVVTAVGDMPYFVEDGVTGRVVSPGDPAALAATITEMLNNEELRTRLGEAAAAAARTRFDIDQAVHRVEAIYTELARRATAS